MRSIKKYQKKCGAKFDADFPKISTFQEFEYEYQEATNGRAIFDLAGLNILHVSGKDCADMLHRMTMNEIRKMQANDIVVNAFTNANGRLIDAFFQIKRQHNFLLITSHGQGQNVAEWLDRYIFIEDVQSKDVTLQFALFLLTGKTAANMSTNHIDSFHLQEMSIDGKKVELAFVNTLLPKGLLLLVPVDSALPVYKTLVQEKQYTPAGAMAFHALRVEQGVPIYGHEFSSGDTNPYEAGLKKSVSFTKGCYIGQEVVARLDTYDKVKYEYSRLSVSGPPLQNLPAAIIADNKEVGMVTSSARDVQNNTKSLAIGRIRRKALHEKKKFHVVSGSKSFDVKAISSTLNN